MTDPLSDTHLLASWHARTDADAFRLLCERHTGLVEAACRRHGSPDAAEAAQAVFLVLARRAGAVDGACLCGWLTVTAQRVVLNQRRAAANRRRHEEEAAVEQVRQRAAATEPAWAEARPHLDAALASLSSGRREAVLRFYLQGKPQAEVAAELGCSVDAVKTRVHEGLASLRAFFARRGVALGAAVLASGLAAEASAAEPGLSATCLSTVLNPASAPGAQALARKVLTAMFVKTSALVATGLLLLASGLMAVLLPAAESAPPPPPPPAVRQADPVLAKPAPPTDAERAELTAGNNRLALDLFAKIRAKDTGNLFISPFSIRAALAMTYAGARGATAAQMKQAMHFSLGDERLHAAMGHAITALNAGDKGCELAVANSLWGERSATFLKPFLELNQACYGAGLESVDFKTAAGPARQRINGWVEAKTQQRIKELIPAGGVNADTRLVLVNAVYFKGAWAARFDKAKTTEEAWRPLADGKTRMQLMHRRADYRYVEQRLVDNPTMDSGPGNGLVQVLELPYAGDAVSMLVLLPHFNTNLSDVESELTVAKLDAAIAALRSQEVEVGLPRFSMTWGTKDLGPRGLAALSDLGMQDAFDGGRADFSGMDGTRNLCIDAVFHKAFVDVQEEGTEAAAATAVVMKPGSPVREKPAVFRADRPFLFLLRERSSGTILFLGRVTAP